MKLDLDIVICISFFLAVIFAVAAVIAASYSNVFAFVLLAINFVASYLTLQRALDIQKEKE